VSDLVGLPKAVSTDVEKWAAVFDFDTDSCYPSPAVSPEGTMSGGLEPTGSVTGGCRNPAQLSAANTYCRTASTTSQGVTYRVYMYALYFLKDESSPGEGHRHDWEYALVWTRNNVLTHASFSAHGEVVTHARQELYFDNDKPSSAKMVYHKSGASTHALRPAKPNEQAINETRRWITPTPVEWQLMKGRDAIEGPVPVVAVSNSQLRGQFNTYNFGKANCPFNDPNFPKEVAKNPPDGYPHPREWSYVASGRWVPPEPAGLVTRWLVFPQRDPGQDDRAVGLLAGQRAKIVVNFTDERRSTVRFNLKHDKHNADDRARTPIIGHGDIVSGDSYDWPSFGTRIYLGELNPGSVDISPGLYVDLVRL
jgi:hypothetical protein